MPSRAGDPRFGDETASLQYTIETEGVERETALPVTKEVDDVVEYLWWEATIRDHHSFGQGVTRGCDMRRGHHGEPRDGSNFRTQQLPRRVSRIISELRWARQQR